MILLTGFYMRATLALNGLNTPHMFEFESPELVKMKTFYSFLTKDERKYFMVPQKAIFLIRSENFAIFFL